MNSTLTDQLGNKERIRRFWDVWCGDVCIYILNNGREVYKDYKKAERLNTIHKEKTKLEPPIWCGDIAFSDLFPAVYRVQEIHNDVILKFWNIEDNVSNLLFCWNFHAFRNLNDREVKQFLEISNKLENCGICSQLRGQKDIDS